MFYVFSGVAITAATLMILNSSPVTAVLNMIVVMFCLAGLFVLLHAHFIAVIQVLVYAGAIMVLFMFIVMLLNLRDNVLTEKRRKGNLLLNAVAILLAVGGFVKLFMNLTSSGLDRPATVPEDFGTTAMVAESLFTRYLLPFEIASVLLLVSIIGAVVLARKRKIET